MKKCRTCGAEKPLEEYHLRKGAPDGRHADCCVCRSAHVRAQRHAEPERHTLTLMIQRCHNPKSPKFHHYGGRGIVVCDRWRESFDAFLADVGPKPSTKHSIDRHPDPNGNYEPGNCRWATQSEQMRNTRITRKVVVAGVERPLRTVADELGVNDETIFNRMKLGMSVEDALAKPIQPKERLITFNGVTRNAGEWSGFLGGCDTLVCERVAAGWSEEDAVSVPVGARVGRRRRA